MDLVAYLLCYALEIKDKPRTSLTFQRKNLSLSLLLEQHGFCRALSYIIQTLSADPAFGPKLTKPVKAQLPAKWNAVGTAADFMINVRLFCAFWAQVLTKGIGGIRHCGHYFRDTQLTISCAYHCTGKFRPSLQRSHRDCLHASHPVV